MSTNPQKSISSWLPQLREQLRIKYCSLHKRITVIDNEFQIASHADPFVVISVRVKGIDDPVYSKSRAVWSAIPRGQSWVYDQSGQLLGSVQGSRKFGNFEDRSVLPFGSLDKVRYFRAMEKENGENAQVSAFRTQNGSLYWLAGSKNVHVVFKDAKDLLAPCYQDTRYRFAVIIANLVTKQLSSDFQSWLADNKYTAVGEAILDNSQHLVDYCGAENHIRFFALTDFKEIEDDMSLIACPPNVATEHFKRFRLRTPTLSQEVEYIPGSAAFNDFIRDITMQSNSEGCVLYGTNCKDVEENACVTYMCKVKTVSYVLERAVRQATFQRMTALELIQNIEQTAKKIFQQSEYHEAVEKWMNTRLHPVLVDFSGWIQTSDFGKQLKQEFIQNNWINFQKQFLEIVQSSDVKKNWWLSENVNSESVSADPIIIAGRGLPCSGKSSTLRALKILLDKKFGESQAAWINQDEQGGNKNLYLRSIKNALSQYSARFILLDKSNIAQVNLLDVVELIGRPVNVVLDFAHTDDEPGKYNLAKAVCATRFQARSNSHRSLRQDKDINMILGMMSKLSLGNQKMGRLSMRTETIDIRLDKVAMLRHATLPRGLDFEDIRYSVSDVELEAAIGASQAYEDFLGRQLKENSTEPNVRYSYFALFPRDNLLERFEKLLPPEAYEGKTPVKQLHVTISYHSDFISPVEYMYYSGLLKSDPTLFDFEVTGCKWNDRATTVIVELPERLRMHHSKKIHHVTVALAPNTAPFYSNELLGLPDSAVKSFTFEPILLSAEFKGVHSYELQPKSKTVHKNKKGQKSIEELVESVRLQPAAGLTKIASDIGGVIYETEVNSIEGHIISKTTKTIPGSLQALKKLVVAGYDVHLLSFCGPETEAKTRAKLHEDNVTSFIPESKWLFCRERLEKPSIMTENDIKLLIDDTAYIIEAVRNKGLEGIVFGAEAKSWEIVLKRIDGQYGLKQQKEKATPTA